VALAGLTLTVLRVRLGLGRIRGGVMRTAPTGLALMAGMFLAVTTIRAQDAAPPPPPTRAVHELLALSYPELLASGLEMREVLTPDGVVVTFAPRGPADPALAAHTPPARPLLTVTVTADGTGRVRQVECRGAWTNLERTREVLGATRVGMAARLRAARARFGDGQGEDVKTEVQRLLARHGLPGVRVDTATLQEGHDTVVWVTHGATEAGEPVDLHLEPLTGKLIAFHVGGAR
jgi:hypothetical protein